MQVKYVKVDIIDREVDVGENPIQQTYTLMNPNMNKLKQLKYLIENRHNYKFDKNLSKQDIQKCEEFCDNVWENIDTFVQENFVTIDIDEVYEIKY